MASVVRSKPTLAQCGIWRAHRRRSVFRAFLLERNESAELYDEGGRAELAQQEREEIAIIPLACRLQMSEDEVKAAIAEAFKDTAAAAMKDMGRIMPRSAPTPPPPSPRRQRAHLQQPSPFFAP